MVENNDGFEITDPETGEVWRLVPEQLVQDIRDLLLRSVRENGERKPWPKMSEAEQRDIVDNIEMLALDLVRKTVEIIAQGKNDVVHAILEKFVVKDGAVQLTASGIADDAALLSLNHVGKKALKIVITDVEQYDKHHEPAQVMRDEPIMFEDEGGAGGEPEAGETGTDIEAGEQEAGRQLLSQEYQGGFNSRMGGYSAIANPFDSGTEQSLDWLAGWDAANARDDAPDCAVEPVENSEDNGDAAAGDADTDAPEVEAVEVEESNEPLIVPVPEENPELDLSAAEFGKYFTEGAQAFFDGEELEANPYLGDGPVERSWADGWKSQELYTTAS